MLFQRYYLGCLAHASYLIADERTGVAAVVDPQRDIDQYVQEASDRGLEIKYVFLTHFHADFIAGHIELRDRFDARIYLGADAQADYDFTPVREGDTVEFGDVRLKVMETPGHTPEGISILVFDLAKNDRDPYAVLTGDTLFIGDVGRPDLLASIGVTADELADMLFDSLHHKLMSLPDETLVYPAHGAGSMCGKNLSDEAFSTIGEQKKYNYALQPMSREDFKDLVTAEQPEAPEYFAHDAILNRRDRQSLDDAMKKSQSPLSVDQVRKQQDAGAQIVDVRDAAEFAGAHLKGSINIGLDGKYATWCGTILDRETPIVVIADEGREEEAIMRLGRIGFDHVQGYLQGGISSLDPFPELVTSAQRISAKALYESLQGPDRPRIVDIRTPKEFAPSHIENATNIPLNRLKQQLSQLDKTEPIAVHCAGGYRSSIAASLLAAEGFERVFDMVGGFKAWTTSGLPTVGNALTTA